MLEQDEFDPNSPQLYILDVSLTGAIKIGFTRQLIIPSNITQLNEKRDLQEIEIPVFDIEIIPADQARRPKLNFTWSITEFYSNSFKVQLYFENPLQVSFESGMRDQFRLTVTNSSLLVGQETYSKIQEGSAIATFLPPQVRTED